jgi:hypothetical protein
LKVPTPRSAESCGDKGNEPREGLHTD